MDKYTVYTNFEDNYLDADLKIAYGKTTSSNKDCIVIEIGGVPVRSLYFEGRGTAIDILKNYAEIFAGAAKDLEDGNTES